MDFKISKFMGFNEENRTEMNNLWCDILSQMMRALDQYSVYKFVDFSSLSGYIEKNKNLDKENAYFWEWLEEQGLNYLNRTDRLIPSTEDVEDFLNYRSMILEMDIESGSQENLIISVTELLKSVADFIEEYLINLGQETAFKNEFLDIRIPVDALPQYKTAKIEENWKILKSSAEAQAELLVYT